jgi:hypothetical protein
VYQREAKETNDVPDATKLGTGRLSSRLLVVAAGEATTLLTAFIRLRRLPKGYFGPSAHSSMRRGPLARAGSGDLADPPRGRGTLAVGKAGGGGRHHRHLPDGPEARAGWLERECQFESSWPDQFTAFAGFGGRRGAESPGRPAGTRRAIRPPVQRRAGIELVMGHMKTNGRLDCNFLADACRRCGQCAAVRLAASKLVEMTSVTAGRRPPSTDCYGGRKSSSEFV